MDGFGIGFGSIMESIWKRPFRGVYEVMRWTLKTKLGFTRQTFKILDLEDQKCGGMYFGGTRLACNIFLTKLKEK